MILLDDHEINNEIYIILVNYIKEPPLPPPRYFIRLCNHKQTFKTISISGRNLCLNSFVGLYPRL